MTIGREDVILVDENDNEIGTIEKIEAHEKSLLHRAFSVFVFNSKSQVLLQKRSESKYHSSGLWTNTCCGHPRPGELVMDAALRRLNEEMGFKCPIAHQFSFIYKTPFENGLTEYELDHVFFGRYEDFPEPNPLEASDWKYMDFEMVKSDAIKQPEQYTTWFKICLDKIHI